jgi:hypothetical protein
MCIHLAVSTIGTDGLVTHADDCAVLRRLDDGAAEWLRAASAWFQNWAECGVVIIAEHRMQWTNISPKTPLHLRSAKRT